VRRSLGLFAGLGFGGPERQVVHFFKLIVI
jgi:hypothetical protein